MTTISLNATDILPDLLPAHPARRKPPQPDPAEASAALWPAAWGLLPSRWRTALLHRARQRELEIAFARLSETSPHLLADAGLDGGSAVPPRG